MSGGYKLYGRANAGSLAVQIVLEEIGAPYELLWVGRTAAELEAFRRINPAGKVPALVLPDGTPVFESAAILIHLTNAHPTAALAPVAGSTAHARFLQWMLFLSSNVYEAVLRVSYSERYSTVGTAAAAQIKAQALEDYARHLELIHGALAPHVLERLFAADPYLHMPAGGDPQDAPPPDSPLPKPARAAAALRGKAGARQAGRG